MKKTLLLLALLIWTGMQAVMAQSATVSGKVVDQNGEALPFASVQIKGTDVGTLTTSDGTFSVTVPGDVENPVLLIRTTGFADREISISGSMSDLTVKMSTSVNTLKDVMVIGYGTTTKEKYVGAADKITSEDIQKFPVADFTKAMEGMAPGIQVTNGSGAPGSAASFRIRGIGSLTASSAPLFVVDGSPFVGDLNSINPDDIESITTLKDATATSLYGSRGANGVVLVTTKKGKLGVNSKPQLSVNAQVGFVRRGLPNYNVLTSEKDFYELSWEAMVNNLSSVSGGGFSLSDARAIASGLVPGEPGMLSRLGNYNSYNVPNGELLVDTLGHLNPNATLRYHDDWQKELERTGLRQSYNLSVTGSSEKSAYYMSFGYMKEQGYVKYSDYDRFTARMNADHQVTDWLKVGLDVNGSFSNTKNVTSGDGNRSGGYNPFMVTRTLGPIYPVFYYNENGQREIDPIYGDWKYDWGDTINVPQSSIGNRNPTNSNVLGSLRLDNNNIRDISVNAIPYVEVKFLKHFTAHTDINYNYLTEPQFDYNNTYYGQFSLNGGALSRQEVNMTSYTWKQYIQWQQDFGKHDFSVLVDHENYYMKINQLSGSGTGLVLPNVYELANATVFGDPYSQQDNHRIQSYLGILNYNYDGKYFLSASVRRDGSSRFAPDKRWGTFWAVGGAWNMSQENFLRSTSDWLDFLKLKASYGTQGNENLGSTYYPYQSNYDLGFANGTTPGGFLVNIANPDLHWETSKQFNVGTEFSFLKSRLSGEVNFFIRTNADLLFNVPTPPSLGVTGILANTATLRNTGIEFTINADVVRGSDFTWSTMLNGTSYKSVISKMPQLIAGQDSLITGTSMWKKGHSIYDYYLIDGHVDEATGEYKYYYFDSLGNRLDTTSSTYATDNGGRQYHGGSLPKFSGAWRNQFQYKGFDLSFLVTFALGGKYYDGVYAGLMSVSGQIGGTNWSKDMLDRWTPENPHTDIPRLDESNNDASAMSTRWLVSGNYLNFRNLSLGYTFKPNWITSAGLSSLRLSISVDNVFLVTARQGMDPQANFGSNDPNAGSAGYRYSPNRTVMFGVNVGL